MPGKGRVVFQGYPVSLMPQLNHSRKKRYLLQAESCHISGGDHVFRDAEGMLHVMYHILWQFLVS